VIEDFPTILEVPQKIFHIDGNCGPIAAWAALHYFKKRVSQSRIISACHYTKKHGVFTIWLAVALHEFGLAVRFFSDPDLNPKAIEKKGYRVARKYGIEVEPAICPSELLKSIDRETIAIVFYITDMDQGHFSPLIGTRRGKLVLPYSENGVMSEEEFTKRSSAPDILRQCVLVSRKSDTT
jgi:hypothetical protein